MAGKLPSLTLFLLCGSLYVLLSECDRSCAVWHETSPPSYNVLYACRKHFNPENNKTSVQHNLHS